MHPEDLVYYEVTMEFPYANCSTSLLQSFLACTPKQSKTIFIMSSSRKVESKLDSRNTLFGLSFNLDQ